MGKSKSVGWNHVVLLQEQPPRVQCTLCDHVFPGTGTRIAEHLARIGNQVKHCTGDVPESVITQITSERANRQPGRRSGLGRLTTRLRISSPPDAAGSGRPWGPRPPGALAARLPAQSRGRCTQGQRAARPTATVFYQRILWHLACVTNHTVLYRIVSYRIVPNIPACQAAMPFCTRAMTLFGECAQPIPLTLCTNRSHFIQLRDCLPAGRCALSSFGCAGPS